jgi:ABC-2 type transport system ATP-binding protein
VLLSTHQTEDVAALCDRVVVLDQGRIRFDGAVLDLVATAAGRVWLADAPHPAARASWRTGTGRHRNVGDAAPADADPTEPTLEDAYLLLLGDRALATQPAA